MDNYYRFNIYINLAAFIVVIAFSSLTQAVVLPPGASGAAPRSLTRSGGTPVEFSGTIVAPPPCTINGDNADMNVAFERVNIAKIDGVYDKQDINLAISCDASFTSDLKMTVQANEAGFGSGYVKIAGIDDLGIEILNETTQVYVNKSFPVIKDNTLNLKAVLVKNAGATLTPQVFNATATILLELQ